MKFVMTSTGVVVPSSSGASSAEVSTRSFMLAVPLALPASEVVTLTSTPRSAATDSTLTFNSTDVPMPLPHTQRMFMIPSFLSLE